MPTQTTTVRTADPTRAIRRDVHGDLWQWVRADELRAGDHVIHESDAGRCHHLTVREPWSTGGWLAEPHRDGEPAGDVLCLAGEEIEVRVSPREGTSTLGICGRCYAELETCVQCGGHNDCCPTCQQGYGLICSAGCDDTVFTGRA